MNWSRILNELPTRWEWAVLAAVVAWRAMPAGPLRPRFSVLSDVKAYASADGAFTIAVGTRPLVVRDRILHPTLG